VVCAKGTEACIEDSWNKVKAIAEMVLKIVAFPVFGAVALALNWAKLVFAMLKIIYAAAQKIYQVFFKLNQLVEINKDPKRVK